METHGVNARILLLPRVYKCPPWDPRGNRSPVHIELRRERIV